MAFSVSWAVFVDGTDISTNMRPYLLSLEVADKAGTTADTCRLSLDDTGGQIQLPPTGRAIQIFLEGAQVFEGVVDSTPWSLSRGGGRTLEVNGKGVDLRGKAKERQQWHLDDATLEDALKKGAKGAGLEITVDPELGAVKRDYWSQDRQHFMQWASDLAEEHGATFKIRGKRAVFAKRGAGTTAAGGAMPSVTASIPGNVISVSITPSRGRPEFKKTRVRYFDRESATFMSKEVDVEGGTEGLDVLDTRQELAADEDQAERAAGGLKTKTERESGGGSVVLNIAPEAQAEGTLVLTGARPGIDGSYRITGVTHKADRGGGATTSLDVEQPQGGAGMDSRGGE